MDEQSEAFLKLIGYMMIAPFWITWKILKFSWQLLFKPAIESANHKKALNLASTQAKSVTTKTTNPWLINLAIPAIIFLPALLVFYTTRNLIGTAVTAGVACILSGTLEVRDNIARSRLPAVPASAQLQPLSAEAKRQSARADQLANLRAAVPSDIPERMRVTIQVNEVKHPRMKQERVRHLIGEDSFIFVEAGETTKYAVDMILQMTETERAIIKQHQLDDIVLEDVPLFTQDELLDARINARARIDAAKDPLHKAIEKQMLDVSDDIQKQERRKTRIGDLLVAPYSRIFDAPYEANDYANKLKTEFLPKIRQLLDRYRDYKQTETIEL